MKPIFDDAVFEKHGPDLTEDGEFNGCVFKDCDFSGVSFLKTELTECTFVSCNLSNARFENAILNQVKFTQCKLLGVDFGKCSGFSFQVTFENCLLNYSLFLKNDLRKSVFKKCEFKEAGVIESNLAGVKFIECDLSNTTFENNNLEKADFTFAYNYIINPGTNRLKKARFSMPDVIGLLKHLDIEIHAAQ
jgi:fluoroquinolone resistance protein